jgi:hypothetical protein
MSRDTLTSFSNPSHDAPSMKCAWESMADENVEGNADQ